MLNSILKALIYTKPFNIILLAVISLIALSWRLSQSSQTQAQCINMLSSLSPNEITDVLYHGNTFSGVITDTRELQQFVSALNSVEPAESNHEQYRIETFWADITLTTSENFQLRFGIQSQPERTIEVTCDKLNGLTKSTGLLYEWMISNDVRHHLLIGPPYNNLK